MLQDAIIELFQFLDCLSYIMGSHNLYSLSKYLEGMDAVFRHSEEFHKKPVLEEWYGFAASYYREPTISLHEIHMKQ